MPNLKDLSLLVTPLELISLARYDSFRVLQREFTPGTVSHVLSGMDADADEVHLLAWLKSPEDGERCLREMVNAVVNGDGALDLTQVTRDPTPEEAAAVAGQRQASPPQAATPQQPPSSATVTAPNARMTPQHRRGPTPPSQAPKEVFGQPVRVNPEQVPQQGATRQLTLEEAQQVVRERAAQLAATQNVSHEQRIFPEPYFPEDPNA